MLVLGAVGCDDGGEDGADAGAAATTDGAASDAGARPDEGRPDGAPADAGATPDASLDCACESGQHCERGACVDGCLTADHCFDGTICVDGACVECTGDQDCSNNTVCEDSACVPGCRDDGSCDPGFVCEGGQCEVGCRDDAACGEGLVCEGGQCQAGCRDDAGCDAGLICEGGQCQAGCRDDAGCDEGTICVDATCAAGCRDDAGCDEGTICVDAMCAEGCRDDEGCDAERICLAERCELRGVRCRGDEDCGPDQACDDANQCVAVGPECVADAGPANDLPATASPLPEAVQPGLQICAGDVDYYEVMLRAGWTLTVTVEFARALGALDVALVGPMGGERAQGVPDGNRDVLVYESAEDAVLYVRISGADGETANSYALSSAQMEPIAMCMDVSVYADLDGDGFGVAEGEELVCLVEGDPVPEGFASEAGDCAADDPWRHPESAEICGDWVDDDCEGGDEACPETVPAILVPEWDCAGAPPESVVAFARFPDGGGYFQDGGCFYVFEGLPGEFYVRRQLAIAGDDPSCAQRNGCTCPSLNGWPAYDRRMYAFTLAGAVEDCPELTIIDHGGEQQPVSNACRKYLYQMHFYDIPYSLFAPDADSLERRLRLFPSAEVACVEDAPHRNLPFQSLLNAPFERNPNYQPLE